MRLNWPPQYFKGQVWWSSPKTSKRYLSTKVYKFWYSICRWKNYNFESKNEHSQKRKIRYFSRKIDRYRNVYKNATFSIHCQVTRIWLWNCSKRHVVKWSNAILLYQLQHEDYLMKTLRTIYPYGLNGRTKFMNKDNPRGKIFPPLHRNGDQHQSTVQNNYLQSSI